MADQKRWFKVWTSIISDDDFDTAREGGFEAIGRFIILGAYTALHGNSGVLEISEDTLLRLMRVKSVADLAAIPTFRNVHFAPRFEENLHLVEEGKNRNAKITVTWDKWVKYQEDSTQAERAKASRSKRRGEEKREEEKRREIELPPWLAKDMWEKWREFRRRIRKTMTVHAEELLLKDLARFHATGDDPVAIIEQSIKSGWQGLFALKADRRVVSDGDLRTPTEKLADRRKGK